MNVLDLFSGIGGFSLGLERAGMRTIAFCENDEPCQRVLSKHWPKVPIFENVRDLEAENYKNTPHGGCQLIDGTRGINTRVDIICGGFPCQDISTAGHGLGLNGERSGLWWEFKRLIQEIKPRYAIIENVANLRSKGLQQVLKALWQIGYASEWHIISARSVGAPHLRDRIWIIAYPQESSNTHYFRFWQPFASEKAKQKWWSEAAFGECYWREAQPPICGMDDGLSQRVDRHRKRRIKQLGNAIVPKIAEIIGREIMRREMLVKGF